MMRGLAVLLFLIAPLTGTSALAQEVLDGGTRALTAEEMASVQGGGVTDHAVCPPGDFQQYCYGSSVPKCFLYEGYCAKKLSRLWFKVCVQLPPQSQQSCTWETYKCFWAKKYETVEGGCNNGDPQQECQGAELGEWGIGDTQNACDHEYRPM
jgi:hypothetical protein